LTKAKVIQLGIAISLLGVLSYKLTPLFGISDLTVSSISNLVLIILVMGWVFTYLFRVVNGKMTFMEQRKRYRKEYEKVINDKLIDKFDKLSDEEQKNLLEKLENK
tara:strand:- start:155 stop:472 length:318 start_codon:yes stop_codon:yes gene_type:complete